MKSLDQFVTECREKFDPLTWKLRTALETNLISLKVNHAEHQNERTILVKDPLAD